jgi:mannitol/fructose-specific phosphotransferase system IIA component (Ntr-type)
MRLANLLKESLVLHNLKAETKEAAIDELLELLKKEHPAVNLEVIKDLIIEREEILWPWFCFPPCPHRRNR